MQECISKNGIRFYKTSHDCYGNPRYIVHFPCLLSESEFYDLNAMDGYKLAVKRANKIGGAKYRGRDFGGGIVFQSYSIDDTAEAIARISDK